MSDIRTALTCRLLQRMAAFLPDVSVNRRKWCVIPQLATNHRCLRGKTVMLWHPAFCTKEETWLAFKASWVTRKPAPVWWFAHLSKLNASLPTSMVGSCLVQHENETFYQCGAGTSPKARKWVSNFYAFISLVNTRLRDFKVLFCDIKYVCRHHFEALKRRLLRSGLMERQNIITPTRPPLQPPRLFSRSCHHVGFQLDVNHSRLAIAFKFKK